MIELNNAWVALRVKWSRGVQTLRFFTTAIRIAYRLSAEVDPTKFTTSGTTVVLDEIDLKVNDLHFSITPRTTNASDQ